MDNPETQATLGTKTQKEDKQREKKHNTERYKDEQHGPH